MKNHLSSPNGAKDHSPGLSGHKTAQPWGYYKIAHPSPVRAAENCVLSKLHAYLWTGFYSVALSGLLISYSYDPGLRSVAPLGLSGDAAQTPHSPIIELGRERGGSRGCRNCCRASRRSGRLNGSAPRGCPNCHHGTRGTSPTKDLLDL